MNSRLVDYSKEEYESTTDKKGSGAKKTLTKWAVIDMGSEEALVVGGTSSPMLFSSEDEARAFATFYSLAAQGTMSLIGQADESGKIEYNETPKYDEDTQWIVNRLTGRIEVLTDNTPVAPYSPVLAYRYLEQSAAELVQQTRAQTGWNLSLDRYEDYRPPLLK